MKKLLTLLFLLCWASHSFSQEKDFLLRDINLPGSFEDRIITFIEKDNAGLLWLVSNNGLYRYDGNEVIHFDKKSTPAVTHSSLTVVFADRDDHLWIGAEDGLTRFDLKTWTTTVIAAGGDQLPSLSLHVRAIEQARDGTIYVGSQNGMLYRVIRDSLSLILDLNKTLDGRYRLPSINSVQEPYPGELWLSTTIGKMIRIRNNGGSYGSPECFGTEAFEGAALWNVRFHPSGKCLVGVAGHGLYSFDTRSGIFNKIPQQEGQDLGKNAVVYVAPLNPGEVLLSSNQSSIEKGKLYVYSFPDNAIYQQEIRYPRHLKDNHLDWLRSAGGTILISVNNHIMELIPSDNMFKTFLADAVTLNSIRCVYRHPGGELYIGSYKDGFIRLDQESGEMELIDRKFVYSILQWNADTLLLGTEGDGLYWYEPARKRLSPVLLSAREGNTPGKFITTLCRENRQAVWVGSYQGLFRVNPYTGIARPVRADRLGKTKILSLLKQGSDYTIGTPHGVLRWNSETDFLSQPPKPASPAQPVYPAYSLAAVKESIWVGTQGLGILVMDQTGRITDTINNSGGLASNVVYSLLTTPAYVIAGTQNGLSIISTETRIIRNYSRIDQLPADEFNSAATFRADSTIYMGTVNGIVRFHTSDIDLRADRPAALPIRLTRLTTEHEKDGIRHHYSFPYARDSALVIPPDVRYFSIGFGGLDPSVRELDFYYRLHDQAGWHAIGQRQEITFVEMPPDKYELELAARFPDGQWSSLTLHMPLVVEPAFYQTIWFRILIILALAGIVWAIVRYRERMLTKEKKLRLKIAGDLHDEVGSTLSGISMQADLLLSGRRDNKLNEYLRQIAGSGREAMNTMGDIVWSIDPRNDDHLSLIDRLKKYGTEMAASTGIDFRFDLSGNREPRHLPQIVRQNIMLIFKEALTNISKHAEASQVHVSFTTADRELTLCIADNGKGLPGNPAGGHGLRNMRMRAKAINASLLFDCSGKGLRIVLQRKA